MLTLEVQKVIETYTPPTNGIKRSLSVKNIEHLKERGLISSPTYNVPNHIYFYIKNSNEFMERLYDKAR